MNSEQEKLNNSEKQKPKPSTNNLRVRRETKRRILADLKQLNRKDFGKTITPDQYICLATSLMTPDHLEQLKAQSMTNKDRLNQLYRDHCASHGKVSMDEFIGLLLSGRNQ